MGVRIVVAGVELGQFAAANAGGVEEFQNRAVAQADGVGGIGQGEEAVEFLCAEGFGEAAGLLAREIEVGGRVGREGAAAAQPGEEAADGPEAGKLGVDCQRFVGARGAVVMEIKLIGLDGGAGESGGRG